MRDINIMARALADEFGSAQRLADEVRLLTQRRDLGSTAAGIYLPPRRRRARPLLLLAPRLEAAARRQMLTVALAHHFLRHRSLPWYGYTTHTGAIAALHGDTRAAAEVFAFVQAFEAALPATSRFTVVR